MGKFPNAIGKLMNDKLLATNWEESKCCIW